MRKRLPVRTMTDEDSGSNDQLRGERFVHMYQTKRSPNWTTRGIRLNFQ